MKYLNELFVILVLIITPIVAKTSDGKKYGKFSKYMPSYMDQVLDTNYTRFLGLTYNEKLGMLSNFEILNDIEIVANREICIRQSNKLYKLENMIAISVSKNNILSSYFNVPKSQTIDIYKNSKLFVLSLSCTGDTCPEYYVFQLKPTKLLIICVDDVHYSKTWLVLASDLLTFNYPQVVFEIISCHQYCQDNQECAAYLNNRNLPVGYRNTKFYDFNAQNKIDDDDYDDENERSDVYMPLKEKDIDVSNITVFQNPDQEKEENLAPKSLANAEQQQNTKLSTPVPELIATTPASNTSTLEIASSSQPTPSTESNSPSSTTSQATPTTESNSPPSTIKSE